MRNINVTALLVYLFKTQVENVCSSEAPITDKAPHFCQA
jgi:hypothetical protein